MSPPLMRAALPAGDKDAGELRLFATETALPLSGEPGTASSASAASSVSVPRPALPPQVALQIADVVRQMPNRPVEIALNPDELGRVRLSVATGEGGIVVNVLAERPETLDLLRRHIDTLGQEFRDLGFEDVAFSFTGGEGAAPGTDREPDTAERGTAAAGNAPAEAQPPSTEARATRQPTGLDLRL